MHRRGFSCTFTSIIISLFISTVDTEFLIFSWQQGAWADLMCRQALVISVDLPPSFGDKRGLAAKLW
jgi:hypothetical protein